MDGVIFFCGIAAGKIQDNPRAAGMVGENISQYQQFVVVRLLRARLDWPFSPSFFFTNRKLKCKRQNTSPVQ